MSNTVQDNMVVTFGYILTAEGQEIERATADDPAEYLHGAENIIPGLEEALAGKHVGDKFSITLQPEDAYGEYDEEDLDEIERDDIPDGAELEVGMVLILEDDNNNMFEASVKEINADTVVLDFNPPLAGKTITYDIEIFDIREADEDELEHGHVHGAEEWDDDYEEVFE